MKIALGSDHNGYKSPEPLYKPGMAAFLEEMGHEVLDCGCNGPDAVDYPDVAKGVAEAVVSGKCDRGVLICGTGIGMSITANRVAGVRAAVCTNEEMARLAREHNDANVLCMGKWILSFDECKWIARLWLETAVSDGERHQRRIAKMG